MIRFARRIVLSTVIGCVCTTQAAPPPTTPPAPPPPTQLPVPCQIGGCANNPSFVSSGTATAVAKGTNLTVNQTSNSATLNWASFNIGASGSVVFQQPTSSAVALNRIYDANPSSIFGSLSANGQIYLINANGFIFGATSTVNAAGLLASSLNITDTTFTNGILSPLQNAKPALEPFTVSSQNFSSDGPNGAPQITNTGTIVVQNGAQLTAADGGRLLLAASSVQNAGTLSAPDGQIVLAAGQSVYLQAAPSSDTALRGLIVQVDAGSSAASQLAGAATVSNQQSGSLTAARGNITLAGLMINQDGRISATTSVSANGSVTLTAGTHPTTAIAGGTTIAPTQGGQVTIGADSDIEVLPELTDTATAVDAQTQLPSTVTITGEQVLMHGGTIRAPGGTLTVTAAPDPANANLSGYNAAASIRIDAGTNIDLSGSDATLPMDANLVTVQLRSNEFADDPTQRNGALRGDTVTVDVRADGGLGTPIADVSSAIAAVGRTIAQRTETGGTAKFESLGDIVFNPGASINVSGGATTYLGGSIQTTKLVGANGQIYDIGSANPLLTYTGIINPTFTQAYDKWGVQEIVPTPGLSQYEATYNQGAAAGTVQFAAPSMALDGTLKASSVTGPYQRAGSPLGGTLLIGLPGAGPVNTVNGGQYDYLAPPIEVVTNPTPIVVADTATLPVQTLQLPSTYLTADGFTTLDLASNTNVKLPAGLPLSLPPGSALTVQASRIDIDSSITTLGGVLSFVNEPTIAEADYLSPTSGPGLPRLGIGIGDGVTLQVSGQWTNDSVLAGGVGTQPTLQNGGSINLQLTQPASELVLGNQVALKADAGAWEQSSGTVSYGKGGSLTLDASPPQAALQFGQDTDIEAFGVGTASGGSFALLAPRIDISQGNGSAWTEAQRIDELSALGPMLDLYAPLFMDYGFSKIALTATGPALTAQDTDTLIVEASGTPYLLQTQTLQLDPGYQTHVSGGGIAAFAQATLLQPYQRPVTDLSLNDVRLADDANLGLINYGSIDIKNGATLVGDAGASIGMTGEGNITIAGTLRAPGGDVSVTLASPALFNPSTSDEFDPGYVAGLGITLTPTAVIDVSAGNAVLTPNIQGLLLGSVSDGGIVNLTAQRGSVVADAGSEISFSGTSATLDLADSGGTYTREVVATSAGSLTVAAVESIALLGDLQAQAGTGGSGAASGGSLEVDLARTTSVPGQPAPANQPLQINVVSDATGSSLQVGVATLGVAQLLTGTGIDALTLNAGGAAPGEISFQTAQPLVLNRSLVLESESIAVPSAAASVSAPYVEIGNPLTILINGLKQPLPTQGTGSLSVAADQLTLVGNLSLLGIADLTLSSQGDIQLQGTPSPAGGIENGSLSTAGNVTFLARRVYPDTFTDFAITSQIGSGGSINIDSILAGNPLPTPSAPLSAGGTVSVTADHIEVGGDLFAPFGQITLTANQSLQLSNGSTVSVSGAGLEVPYGQTQFSGEQWVYTDSAGTNTVSGVPTKGVSLTAPNISVQPQATVNLQGGGDLYAYEWVPGTGGSVDALASPANGGISGLYAIIPSQQGLAAPHDPEESGTATVPQAVYLSGGAGISAGYYALLPPRYALAPGAILIQIEPSYSSASGGEIGALANGTPILAGYLSSPGTSLHAGSTTYEGFAIYPSGYAQQLASYTISDASSYFSAAAALAGTGPVAEPADAGVLNLSVVTPSNAMFGTSLALQGTVLTAAATGGRGAAINISAPDLEISTDGSVSNTGYLGISSTVLQSWNASELTLGGSTPAEASAVADASTATVSNTPTIESTATVGADHVIVDGGVTLTADQIFILAHQDIAVDSGATLASTSGKNGTPLATLPTSETLTLSDPSAAIVALSDLSLPLVTRAGSGAGATLELNAGSTLSSGGALVLDAPGNMTVAGTLNGKGASWSLGSDSIAFVGSTGVRPDTLDIDNNLEQALQSAASVRLSSQSSIDFVAPVTLGAAASGATPTLGALTLLATAINNDNSGSSVLGASTLTLGGVTSASGSTPVAPVAGSGTLSLVANTVNLAPNTLAIGGFAATQLQVAGAVSSAAGGVSGLNAAGDLSINAVEITPGAGSNTSVTASGALNLGAPTTLASGTTTTTLVGGALSMQAATILDDGVIAAPSGIVSLNAAVGDLHIGATGSIDVAGTLLQAVNRSAPSPGGTISLNAMGNVALDSGSTVSVAGEQTAPAGSLSIAGDVVTLAGNLTGTAGSGGTGGSFSVDAVQLTGGLTPLASSLMSGGFSNSVNVRVRSGDLTLLNSADPNAAGLPFAGTLSANDITLTADTGTVSIAGVVSAPSAAQRGLIDLSGQNVVLQNGGALHADGSGPAGLGGEIELNATCATCSITLQPGSVITAAGAGQMGELTLRAPALQAANDVAINVLSTGITGMGADVTQAGQVIIEPVLSFTTSNVTVSNDLPTDVATASTFLTAASPVITQRLITAAPSLVNTATPPSVQVGVELDDTADLNPAQPLTLPGIDLSPYSTGQVTGQNQVINLNVRAVGSVAVNGTITDGFVLDPTGNTSRTALTSTPSASISIVAGADLSSANSLATLKGSASNLTLLSSSTPADGSPDGIGPSVVRTGTGDINLAASGNIVFAAGTGGGAAVYTGGLAPANVIGPVAYANDDELQNFGSNGGNVRLTAGGNVVGAPVGATYAQSDNGDFGVTGWLLHQGNAFLPAQYGVDYGSFDWNIGALGGGDVTVNAAGSVTNLSAATADSLVFAANTLNGIATVYGVGGGLTITAGQNIGTAQIYVADGVGTLIAGGGLIPTLSYSRLSNGTKITTPVGSSIALGDSQVSVWARTGLQVDAIYNPTSVDNGYSDTALDGDYSTYGANSSVTLSTTSGAATLQEFNTAATSLGVLVGPTAVSGAFEIAPPTLGIQALQNDIDLIGGPVLAPATQGQLSLFAGRDIQGAANTRVEMSDATLSTVATAADPGLDSVGAVAFQGVVHLGDPNPALITAGRDIVDVDLSIPKAAQIVAGRDIVDLGYAGQNTSASDITLIAAGRDFLSSGSNAPGVQVGGPGSLDVLTGRNLNLGFGQGIVTVGDLVNANLATAAGADVNVMVGYGSQGADLSGFLTKIIAPSATYQNELIDYVESLDGESGLTFAQAQTDFNSLSTSQQSALIDSVFFNELLLSGRAANSGSGVGFQQGYNAIDALFPGSRAPTASAPSPYSGDLTLVSSQIYTDSGGNISILVPGGSIDVGLANPPAAIAAKPASELGIVAEGSGNVDIYSLGDVNVNKSRVFTLGGGNILIWSTLGSIDAGNGSKSSLSVPPPTVTVSETGVVTLNFGGALAAGSGIRTIQTTPDVPPGNVDLDAPVGTVNAGDAGIGAAGNINIAAAHVIGVDNINFGGTATGVPSDLSSLGATLSGASSAAAGTTNSSTQTAQEGAAGAKDTAAPLAQTALSWLDVFVTGLGEDNCKPDDLECLKRQKQAVP